MKKRVLVTGCAGFIGYYVAKELLERGDFVLGVDILLGDSMLVEAKKSSLCELNQYREFEFYKIDICDTKILEQLCKKYAITHIAHLAGKGNMRSSIEDSFSHEYCNVRGTLSVLEVARVLRVENCVITSSSSVYGECRDNRAVDESCDRSMPISPCAATKKACEVMSYVYHHLYSLNINVIRPFTVYGPRGRRDMAAYIFLSHVLEGKEIVKYGLGDSSRDFTYIDDFVRGYIAALDTALGYEIFNLGNACPVTLNEFISTIEEVCGVKAKIKEIEEQLGDVSHTHADISKAKKLLGYCPMVSLKEGLEKMKVWYLQHN